MFPATRFLKQAAAVLVMTPAILNAVPANAEDGFPFGLEMTLDAARQPGSKRVPTLDIGDSGETTLELWCKGGSLRKQASRRTRPRNQHRGLVVLPAMPTGRANARPMTGSASSGDGASAPPHHEGLMTQ